MAQVNEARIAEIREWVKEGCSALIIANRLGISRQRVYQILHHHGIEFWKHIDVKSGEKQNYRPRILTGGVFTAVNQSVVGTISELLVAADLLARGWHVYIPITRTRGHDLIADKGARLITIEVRSAYRSQSTGKLSYATNQRKDPSMFFALVVTGDPVVYEPELPEN
jgi:predicted AAA+ superfamily ATPase